MKKTLPALGLMGMALSASATLFTNTWSGGFVNGTVVPDNDYSGWTDTRTVVGAPAGTIQSLAVNLTLTGGWNGDLYAYLVNGSGGFCVLLDRIGTGTVWQQQRGDDGDIDAASERVWFEPAERLGSTFYVRKLTGLL